MHTHLHTPTSQAGRLIGRQAMCSSRRRNRPTDLSKGEENVVLLPIVVPFFPCPVLWAPNLNYLLFSNVNTNVILIMFMLLQLSCAGNVVLFRGKVAGASTEGNKL